ncbi:threonine dehydratase [Vibrio parahaemolyticus]|uniref:hydroxyectoine utilization dehydratase EutB n=1 Tax=Vibrio diabolicus TaxID=50719 RepID=UPI0006B267BE|nr:hydroxyectoine utilization dehydratase EutB [Vibrio diabolicus]KOY45583.1 threonine dehydratase [Vibrio parahaemolyticus]MCQ9243761.1 hydroxyectoine utilization dehydratase EutB [Vibrio diabolicus]
METQAIFAAKKAINGLVSRTPLLHSPLLSQQYQCEIWLKLETLQPIGAFKLRGATHAMNRLSEEQKQHGVVTCSTGNHGRAVAYAGQRLGVRTVICMSNLVPQNKVDAIKALGAEVRIVGQAQDDAEREALRLTEEESMTYLSPFEHPDIIAGQGTIGLEIIEDLPDVDVIFAGLSGGGLIGGIGLAAKSNSSKVNVYGVSMDKGAAMVESIKAGKPVQVEEHESFADSLGGGIGLDNRYTFKLVQEVMDKAFLVSEHNIAKGMADIFDAEKFAVEGAAAVGLAAIHQHQLDLRGKKVVLVLSGKNVSSDTFETALKIGRQVKE